MENDKNEKNIKKEWKTLKNSMHDKYKKLNILGLSFRKYWDDKKIYYINRNF